jgi:hypothetical protein
MGCVDWIGLTQDGDEWRVLGNALLACVLDPEDGIRIFLRNTRLSPNYKALQLRMSYLLRT